MDAKVKTERTFTLKLTEAEAYWLRCLTQNPTATVESDDDCSIRKEFFHAVKEAQPTVLPF